MTRRGFQKGQVVRVTRDCTTRVGEWYAPHDVKAGTVGVVEGPNVAPIDSRVMLFALGEIAILDNAFLEVMNDASTS